MTIQTIIDCDGDCCTCIEVPECDSVETTLKNYDWKQDPVDGLKHYCSLCWPAVKADREADR